MISQGRAYKDGFYLSILKAFKRKCLCMNGTHNNPHMKKRIKTNANSHTPWIPQIRAASLINSCQTVQCSTEMFLLVRYSPTFSNSDFLQMIYNYNK